LHKFGKRFLMNDENLMFVRNLAKEMEKNIYKMEQETWRGQ
jgi:hypothetical protein